MNDDMHDDGLVHPHGWATEFAPVLAVRAARPAARVIPAPEERDDGLVHGHGWACGTRGAPAHR